ncbi:signal transduction histidine kinase [Cyanobium sp. Copco_Reservoir_LC18]|jgi:signal transduction histidine kinase/ActR/RegA family two-component response regulator|uniref:response regulator n=1 Tax=Cyanobium sp. Copco_Reservoir_LC18 TaxID=1328305 RepID=UPI00135AD73B|nr:response regulator [Cyanobium sp. Copco_Reservoir_LC18]KAF0654036.1 signal transduction histidine kinase [Cyanobium sp. Copco_Reservoir_LC18]
MADPELVAQLRTTLGRLEAALGAVEEALAFTDLDGTVEWTNASFDRFVGLSRLQCLGRSLSGILPDRQSRDLSAHRADRPFWREAPQGTTTWELTSTPPRRVIEVSWATVNVPSKPSLVFTFRDQSAIVQAQDRLIDARDQLEQQVAQRTRELRQARDEALAASQSKTRFLATMSHEIRTPLNAVIGMSDLLLASPMEGRQREMIQTIHESGDYLLNLVNDILDISQIETGRLALNPRTFDLHSLLDDVLNLFRHQASIRQLDLQLSLAPETPRWLIGDDLKLRQILFNLLGNACKYTNQGEIRLVVEATRSSPEAVGLLFRVSDTGIGIAAGSLPFIFEEFVGHDNPEQTSQSAGLGLAICARLCQLMAGEISVESSLGTGSCFSVRLPFAVASKSQKRPTEPPASDGFDPGWKILVADDNRVNQRVLELMLARLHLSVQLAGDGNAALQSVRSEPFDLVVMDVEMPGLDGISAARQLRREGYTEVYIIALTAYSFSSHRQECEAAGMNDFLSKPLRFVDLCAALDRFRAWRRARPSPPA